MVMIYDMARLTLIYQGSDGDATKELYAECQDRGWRGRLAMNLFRAQKCSERAKVYRWKRFRGNAYDRKQWSMDNLCQELTAEQANHGFRWGWKGDPEQAHHRWVLYVDLPTGQVSFHTDRRGLGPDYDGEWDQSSGTAVERILCWIAKIAYPWGAVAG